jgi:hypothetical protein
MIFQAGPLIPPVPPAVPSPPFDPNFLMRLDPPAVVMILLAAMVACTIVLWPIARALARRLEGRRPPDQAIQGDLDHLHERLAEVDALQQRVSELEERIEFAERLLARGEGAAAQLPRGPS